VQASKQPWTPTLSKSQVSTKFWSRPPSPCSHRKSASSLSNRLWMPLSTGKLWHSIIASGKRPH
jgi:hypothetical protein